MRWILLVMMLMVSSCSMFGPVQDNSTTYVLNDMPQPAVRYGYHGILYISPVTATPLYDTNEMAYSTNDLQVEYYARNRWNEPPAKMIRPLALQTIQKTHHFHAVTTSNGIRYNYALNLQLLELRQIFSCKSSYVSLRLQAEIVSAKTGKIIATRVFDVKEPVYKRCPAGGAASANRALVVALNRIANFVTAKT